MDCERGTDGALPGRTAGCELRFPLLPGGSVHLAGSAPGRKTQVPGSASLALQASGITAQEQGPWPQ